MYPHHNLYFITSKTWNLQALKALLRTGIAHLFVEAYSTRLGGGYLQFQAQNLKRIRVPYWESIADDDKIDVVPDISQWGDYAADATHLFWSTREQARQRQIESGAIDQGERAGVTVGKNMTPELLPSSFATCTGGGLRQRPLLSAGLCSLRKQ